jgi:hypothetical protein
LLLVGHLRGVHSKTFPFVSELTEFRDVDGVVTSRWGARNGFFSSSRPALCSSQNPYGSTHRVHTAYVRSARNGIIIEGLLNYGITGI